MIPKNIIEEENKRVQEMLKKQQESQAANFDAQQERYDRFQARQQIGGNKYANMQAKMDAAMQQNQADGNTQSINNTQMGLGAAQQMTSLAQNNGQGGTGDVAQSGVTGAMGGAMMGTMMAGTASGSMAGPIGAGVGAVVGTGVGILKANAAKEQRKRDAQASHQLRIAQIEQDKANRIQNALQNMGAQMGNAMQVPVMRI